MSLNDLEKHLLKNIKDIPVGSVVIHKESFELFNVIDIQKCNKYEYYFVCMPLKDPHFPIYFNAEEDYLMNVDQSISYLGALTIVELFINNNIEKDNSYIWVKDILKISGISQMLSSAIKKLQKVNNV